MIEELELDLSDGLSVITGETGAGKSILLGALSLILGKRADLKALKSNDQKCIVEGVFKLGTGDYREFFDENDLDFDTNCLIRREITPSGKSRSFINDSPVTLDVLGTLANRLVDIHSQHDTLLLNNADYQLRLLDNYAGNGTEKEAYSKAYSSYRQTSKELYDLTHTSDSELVDGDYLEFLFNELETASLRSGEQEELEKELELLEHSGEISEALSTSLQFLDGDDSAVRGLLQKIRAHLAPIENYNPDFADISKRLESVSIELEDLRAELEDKASGIEHNPERAVQLDQRLSLLLNLQRKHHVSGVDELIARREELDHRLVDLAGKEDRIEALKSKLAERREHLTEVARRLTDSRKGLTDSLETKVGELLGQLNMPAASLHIELHETEDFQASGKDKISYLFSANQGQAPMPLSKVASGGELSRVMLALKAIMASTSDLPSIIFDEIDTGVSGETADRIGEILSEMGRHMQVMAITHLPQIASKGKEHFKVIKSSEEGVTRTLINRISAADRVDELARLLSGERISPAALENARVLLENVL